ncbi:MAG: T9SS type A sorting domain-containing protein [Bacteroidota bacterium]
MKNLILLIVFFAITSSVVSQDLRFSFTETNMGTTSEIKVFVVNSAAIGTENMAGFSSNLYYDNSESSITSFDFTPSTNNLGWNPDASSTTFVATNNGAITSLHNGFGNINIIDQNFTGTDIGQTQVHILTINVDHSVGSAAASAFYLASSSENHPALEYVGNDFIGHPVIVANNVSFPVEYLDFNAKAMDGWVSALTWSTATESNNQGFVVQRLDADGMEWESIGFVAGSGNSNSALQYSFMDTEPYSGENAYRLKQIDFDGASHLSVVRSVRFESGFTLDVYPNPTADILKIRLEEIDVPTSPTYQLFDQKGKILMQGALQTKGVSEIKLSGLPEGTYLLRISQGSRIINRSIVKMN